MKKNYCALIILFFLSLTMNAYAGGGWLQPKGKGYFKLSQTVIYGNRYFSATGEVIDISTTGVFLTGVYAEFGVTDGFTVILNAPITTMSINGQQNSDGTVTAGDSVTSAGDIDVAIKYGIYRSAKLAISGSIYFGIPSGNSSAGENGRLQTGDGEFNQLSQLDVGVSLGKGYVNGTLGYNNRTQGFSDEFRWGIEGGMGFGKFYFIVRVNAVHSLQNSTVDETNAQSIFSNNTEYIAFTPEVNYFITDHFGVSANYGSVFSAKRILAVPSFNLGIFYKM